ncbi:MAG: EVE domain-containing protein [Proteobacteria bacterium]|nr:EVE domain-containing protein [Pseudomonadota bacterium]
MAYWLMKSEPSVFSWDDLVKARSTKWDGVRNYAARNNLEAMKVGDLALFYHSNEGKAVVGVMEIAKTAEPDMTVEKDELAKDGSNPWRVVTVKPLKALKAPVTLEMVKGDKRLKEMALVKLQRLSVQQVTAAEWKVVLALGGGE